MNFKMLGNYSLAEKLEDEVKEEESDSRCSSEVESEKYDSEEEEAQVMLYKGM